MNFKCEGQSFIAEPYPGLFGFGPRENKFKGRKEEDLLFVFKAVVVFQYHVNARDLDCVTAHSDDARSLAQ